MECSSAGGPDNTYQWQVNGSDITGATSPTLSLLNVQASTGGMYTCVVSNAAGTDDASTFLYISPYFVVQPTNTLTSSGSLTSFTCEAEAFPHPNYQWWRVDGEPIRCEIIFITSTLVIESAAFGDEGDYYCNVTSLGVTVQSIVATLSGMTTVKYLMFLISIFL